MTPIERIQEMEGNLKVYQGLIEELEACLQRVEAGQSSYIALRDYYTSQVYMDDVELSNQPDFPEEVYCGVLSEDARPCDQNVERTIRTQKTFFTLTN